MRIEHIEIIPSASIPIIKFMEAKHKIWFDISFNETSGLDALKLYQKELKEWPVVEYLTIILKLFLKQRRLNETF